MKVWLLRMIKGLAIFFVCLYSFIWLFSPALTRLYSTELLQLALQENDLVLAESSSVRYNPFLSHLSIDDFVLTKGTSAGKEVLSIKELNLEISLYKLIIGHFQISEFEIDGIYVNVTINDDHIEVAGIAVSSEASTKKPAPATEELEEALDIIVKMAQFHLQNSKIDLYYNNQLHTIDIAMLAVERVHASATEQQLGVTLVGQIDNAPFSLNITEHLNNNIGIITASSSLTGLELINFNHLLPDNISTLTGQVNYHADYKISLDKDATTINIKQLEINTEQLKIQQDTIQAQFTEQTFTSDDVIIKLVPQQTPVISMTALLRVNNFLATPLLSEQVLLKFDNLAFANIKLTSAHSNPQLAVENITLAGVTLSDNTSNDIPALVKFKAFSLGDLIISEHSLAIETATLAGLVVDAQLDKNKNLSSLVSLPNAEPSQKSGTTSVAIKAHEIPAPTEQASDFALYIGKFSLIDDAAISFNDYSVSPLYQRNFAINTLSVGPIDNQKTAKKTLFEITGKSQKYAHFDFAGFSLPFAKQPVHHIKGAFKEISLPAVSTYMKDALQYVFDSGQLDLSVDTTITGDDISGEMGILMRGLELTAAEDDEVNSIKDQTAIPFSVALGMLKDRDGNVELDIPLTGKTDDPSFGVSGFIALLIKQATMSAAQDYLMTTFVPYANVISIAMTAGDYLLKIRFNDMVFPATQTELQSEHDTFLAEFAALLKERPDENITLCAVSTVADIGKTAGADITNQEERKKLTTIALTRMDNFKSYMVNNAKLNSSRLLLCTPQIDSATDAKPRITFSN